MCASVVSFLKKMNPKTYFAGLYPQCNLYETWLYWGFLQLEFVSQPKMQLRMITVLAFSYICSSIASCKKVARLSSASLTSSSFHSMYQSLMGLWKTLREMQQVLSQDNAAFKEDYMNTISLDRMLVNIGTIDALIYQKYVMLSQTVSFKKSIL